MRVLFLFLHSIHTHNSFLLWGHVQNSARERIQFFFFWQLYIFFSPFCCCFPFWAHPIHHQARVSLCVWKKCQCFHSIYSFSLLAPPICLDFPPATPEDSWVLQLRERERESRQSLRKGDSQQEGEELLSDGSVEGWFDCQPFSCNRCALMAFH